MHAIPAARTNPPRPVVFVTVGTDHHPFDRLVAWADAWAAAHPDVLVFVQYGSATPPARAAGAATLPYLELQQWMRRADVVVTQGGPAGIVDARDAGRLPIVVPRVSLLGEHVDDHQVAFATHMDAYGRVVLASDERAFVDAVERALAEPRSFTVDGEQPPSAATAAVIDDLLSRLVQRPRRGLLRR